MGSAVAFWEEMTYFTPTEFDSPDMPGTGILVDEKLLRCCEMIRQEYGKPVKINSGVRSTEHNKKVDGKKNSDHLLKDGIGHGIDIAVTNSQLRYLVLKFAFVLEIERVGVGNNFIHLGTSLDLPQRVVWVYGK